MMLTWRTAGQHCPSFSSAATYTWLWKFGRGKPRLGGLTIEETSDRQDSASKASDKRRKETSDGHKGDGA